MFEMRTDVEHRCGQVALVGRPNVGKSSLLNRLLGQKISIVTHKAQTTRHRILGIHNLPAAQIVFIDTPGIHTAGNALGRYMNQVAHGARTALYKGREPTSHGIYSAPAMPARCRSRPCERVRKPGGLGCW